MSKWRLELRKIGRGKVSKDVEITTDTLPKAEQKAIKECGRYLMSRDIGLAYQDETTYLVTANCRGVGQLRIISI